VATEDQHNENKVPPSLSDRGVARRRLVKAGAGVLLTLEAKAALANPVCATPSGYLSGGLHNSHYGPQTCNGGYSPGYWKQKTRTWPDGLDRNTLAFTAVFPLAGGCQTTPVSEPKDYTGGNAKGLNKDKGKPEKPAPVQSYQCALLEDVLSHQPFDANNLGMHMAATYLNICAGYIDFMKVEDLQRIWTEVSTTGVYQPTAGITWSREELKEYFKATMHPG
jgi:hypothetical protein